MDKQTMVHLYDALQLIPIKEATIDVCNNMDESQKATYCIMPLT